MLWVKVSSLLLIAVLGTTRISAETLILRLGYSDIEAPPYQIRHDQIPPGIAFDIISQASHDIDVELNFFSLPNRRVQESLKLGEIDGAFMFSFKKDRKENGQYPMIDGELDSSKRIAVLSYYLYRRKGSDLSWDTKKITGTITAVGANSGYSIVDDLKKMGIPVQEAKSTEQNFSKLLMQRIDAVAHQDLVADGYIDFAGIGSTIEKLNPALSTKDYFLMFSHQFMDKHNDIAQKMWSRISEIREAKTQEVLYLYH